MAKNIVQNHVLKIWLKIGDLVSVMQILTDVRLQCRQMKKNVFNGANIKIERR